VFIFKTQTILNKLNLQAGINGKDLIVTLL